MSNAYGIVTLKEYFKVMDVVFSPSFNLASDLRKRLAAMYPNIRVSSLVFTLHFYQVLLNSNHPAYMNVPLTLISIIKLGTFIL